jgi:hypothetical protein
MGLFRLEHPTRRVKAKALTAHRFQFLIAHLLRKRSRKPLPTGFSSQAILHPKFGNNRQYINISSGRYGRHPGKRFIPE